MPYNIQQVKADLEGILHGTSINQIQGLDNLINRAARQLLLDIDPQETIRVLEFTNPIFNDVFSYPIAPDVKGTAVIDIRPQVRRLPIDIWTQAYNQAFDIAKQNIYSAANMFTVNFNTGLKTLNINAPYLNPPVILNQADNITDNGTWATGGGASNLTVDNVNFVQGAGSLKFDLASSLGYVQNSTMAALNLSNYINQASIFLQVYLPVATDFTSVVLRFGSSSANYYEVTVTQTQQSTAFVNGWNLLQFQWNGATVVGTPNTSAINYLRVTYNYTGINTGVHLNGVQLILGSILEYEYYSKYLFRDAITGAFQETVTDDSNLINLDTESYNLLFNLVAHLAVQQQQGADAVYDGEYFGQKYQDGMTRYKGLYKSQRQKPQSVYYRKPNLGYGQYLGRGFNQ